MSVAAIVGRIEAEAEAEAAAIAAEAEAKARALVAAARDERRARTMAALERAEPVQGAAEARTINAARLRLLERRAERSSRHTGAVFEAAAQRIASIEATAPDRWADALRRLAGEALAAAGDGAVVLIRASDAGLVEASVRARGGRVDAIDDAAPPPGLLVRSADGRLEIDATMPARLARARIRLAEPVARLLGLEG